jgi:hypothetical protein
MQIGKKIFSIDFVALWHVVVNFENSCKLLIYQFYIGVKLDFL